MNLFSFLIITASFISSQKREHAIRDSLPVIFSENRQDVIESRLRLEAQMRFASHRLPENLPAWTSYREVLKEKIIEKAGVLINHKLPLEMAKLGTLKMEGYTIYNIIFQTRPGVFATANLFVPDGPGPFPAVINMHAHAGRFDDEDQAVGHILALNGYVCLSIDPWGAGERTTIHGQKEYHGANLGASFMNIGETLMGVEISDNIRGVDLLSSLPYVDATRIGATGASGGGNQTMWLAAIDERVQAAVPVVSVGTFESYVMRDNCICETLVDGLDFTEEAGVLALVAPRAIKICNHLQDRAPAFYPSEMLRSFRNAEPIFELTGTENKIDYQLFDLPHGYLVEDREAMLGFFDLHLKGLGNGGPKKEKHFKILGEDALMVFHKGQRDPRVLTTEEYCRRRGTELRKSMLSTRAFDTRQKRAELRDILRLGDMPSVTKVERYAAEDNWQRAVVQTSDGKLIPVLQWEGRNPSAGYVVVCNVSGKQDISPALIRELKASGSGIALFDLSGTGESASAVARKYDGDPSFHTLARAELWLGSTLLGEWAKEMHSVITFLLSEHPTARITIDGRKEAGLAALFLSAVEADGGGSAAHRAMENIVLRDAPLSYLFDQRKGVDFFSMAIHLPGFLKWGDISLATALADVNVTFISPLSMSGRAITGTGLRKYEVEFDDMRKRCGGDGTSVFR